MASKKLNDNQKHFLYFCLFFILFCAFVVLFLKPKNGPQITKNIKTTDQSQDVSPTPSEPKPINYNDLDDNQKNIATKVFREIAGANYNPDDFVINELEAKEFSDSSLGCPKDGEAYAQVVSPGFVVKMEYKGESYDYRLNDTLNSVVKCVGN